MGESRVAIPEERIVELCRRNHVRSLALSGSVLREGFSPRSDVDVLVESEPWARVGSWHRAGWLSLAGLWTWFP